MTTRRDDDEHDVRLRAALRHAPDHDAAAPAKLSEQILGAARRSVQPTSDRAPWPRRVRGALASALDALTRPAGAAAFASLVLATVIGVMWHEGDPTEALPERARRPDAAPTERPATPAPAPAAPASPQSPSNLAAEAQTVAPGRAANDATASKAAAESKRRGATADSADVRQVERSQPAPASTETTTTADATRPDAFARDEARQKAAAKPTPPAAERAPPPAQASPAAAATPPAVPAAPPDPPPAAPQVAAPAPAPALPRAAPMAAAPAAPPTLRSSLAATAPDPLASVVLALGQEATHAPSATTHRWQRGNAAALPHGPAAQSWLAELQRATQGAWQPRQGAAAAGANALVLSNEAGVVARVELTDTGVSWHHTSTPNLSWSATLPEETLKRLRENLAAWAGR